MTIDTHLINGDGDSFCGIDNARGKGLSVCYFAYNSTCNDCVEAWANENVRQMESLLASIERK